MPSPRGGGGINLNLDVIADNPDWDAQTDKSFDAEAQLQAIDFDMH